MCDNTFLEKNGLVHICVWGYKLRKIALDTCKVTPNLPSQDIAETIINPVMAEPSHLSTAYVTKQFTITERIAALTFPLFELAELFVPY